MDGKNGLLVVELCIELMRSLPESTAGLASSSLLEMFDDGTRVFRAPGVFLLSWSLNVCVVVGKWSREYLNMKNQPPFRGIGRIL